MQIEEGKYYRTRDGRKVGPMARHGESWKDDATWQFDVSKKRWPGSPQMWHGDGSVKWSYGSHEEVDILVAEWVESPYHPGQLVQLTTNNAWRHGYAEGATVRLDRLTPEGWKIIGGGVVPESDMRPAGPVRRREVVEVVAGTYGRLCIAGPVSEGVVSMRFNPPKHSEIDWHDMTADEIDALIATLRPIAEALRERS